MDDKTTSNPFVESDRDERLEAKRDRLNERADKAQGKAHALHGHAKSMASAIPFGQPILVGHHSERRDRNYRRRISNTYDKAFKEQDKADHYRDRASTVGTGGVSSTAPNALAELTAQLDTLEAKQALMKQVNAEFRKGGIDAITCLGESVLAALKERMSQHWHGDKPYPSYKLSNNSASIRRIRKRIDTISDMRKSEALALTNNAFRLLTDNGRLQFKFDGKPNEEARKRRKYHAFKWSRYSATWVRKATPNAVTAAKQVAEQLTELECIY